MKQETTSHQSLWGRLALIAAALIWGSSFSVLKITVSGIAPLPVLAFRFTGAALLCGAVFFKRLKQHGKQAFFHGFWLGVMLCMAYIVQTYGLRETTPGKNAFLTAVYVVLVPFISAMVLHSHLGWRNWLAALLCLVGIGCISLSSSLTVGRGDWLSLLSGVLYAVHILMLSRWTATDDPVTLTVIQFAVAGAICWISSAATQTLPATWPVEQLPALLYMTVFASAIGLMLQTVGQSIVPESTAALLLSLESAFGVLFSVLMGMEDLTFRTMVGFILIFCGVVVSELRIKQTRTA